MLFKRKRHKNSCIADAAGFGRYVAPMVQSILVRPAQEAALEASGVAFLLCMLAWDRAVGADARVLRKQYYGVVDLLTAFEKANPDLWSELISEDPFTLLRELERFKHRHYPDDLRTTTEHAEG